MTQKRNEKCNCGSGKKYKKCCISKEFSKQREIEREALEMTRLATDGHSFSSENIKTVASVLQTNSFKVIDVSNFITKELYRPIQEFNYKNNTVIIAERNSTNEGVFKERCPENKDIIVMFRGAYQCFEFNKELSRATVTINDMIKTRTLGREWR